MSNKKAGITIGIIIALFVLLATLMVLSNKIPSNPPNATGNSAGNLYNNGLFCEDDGRVFFSNPYDKGCLYSMNSDETDIKKVLDYNIKYINAEGKYIYYYQTESNDSVVMGFAGHTLGVYRCNKNGRKVVCLDRSPSGTISLVGDYLYYQHFSNYNKEGMTLYRIKTDKSESEMVADYIIDPSNFYEDGIYFASTKDNHDLNMLDVRNLSITDSVVKGEFWNPIIKDGYIYYMNVKDNYKLYRFNFSTLEDEKLTDDRVDTYNLTDNYIFYQSNGEDASLKRINLDGSDAYIIRMGVHKNINVTSNAVYFTQFDEDIPLYRIEANGLNITEFSAALNAAEENMR